MGAANITSGLFRGITSDMSLSNTASGEMLASAPSFLRW